MNYLSRRHPRGKDAPGVLGAILASLDAPSNAARFEAHREKLHSFGRARVEPRAPDLFPDYPLLETYCEFGRLNDAA